LRTAENPAIVADMSSMRVRSSVALSRLVSTAGLGGLLLLRPARR
jgi:hypothetical protein